MQQNLLILSNPECDVPPAVAEEEVAAEEPEHKMNADTSPKTKAQ